MSTLMSTDDQCQLFFARNETDNAFDFKNIHHDKNSVGEKVEEVDNETRPSVSRRLGDSLSSLISHQA